MMHAKKRTDKRSQEVFLTQDRYLVQGPAELIQGMRDLAERNGQTIAHVWRTAATEYLERKAVATEEQTKHAYELRFGGDV